MCNHFGITTVRVFIKIISIPNEELFSHCHRVHRSMLCLNYMMFPLVVYPLPSFEAVYCLICGRRRVAVARHRMICLGFCSIAWSESQSRGHWLYMVPIKRYSQVEFSDLIWCHNPNDWRIELTTDKETICSVSPGPGKSRTKYWCWSTDTLQSHNGQ